jgi:glutamate synthase (NADPH/NADH) large chain
VPKAVGLYDPANEHDACGVAMVATLNKTKNHEIVSKALTALRNLEHRGASGAEPDSGDGAGILIQIPDEFYRSVVDFKLPNFSFYATGVFFIEAGKSDYLEQISQIASKEGLRIIGWRDLPINSKSIGKTALSVMPSFKQIFVAGLKEESDLVLERMVFCLRKRVEHTMPIYVASLSSRTIVYKGMLTTGQLEEFFPDLSNPLVVSCIQDFQLIHFLLGH